MSRMHADPTPPLLPGWHPLGLLGLIAALVGVALIASATRADTEQGISGHSHGPSAAGTSLASSPPASTRLEQQRSELTARLSRFPPAEQRAVQIAAVAALAAEEGVVIGSGEYRGADSPMPNELAMLEVRLPLHGPPPAVRAFLASLQRELPWLAIDEFMLERDGGIWRGELRGRLFLRDGT